MFGILICMLIDCMSVNTYYVYVCQPQRLPHLIFRPQILLMFRVMHMARRQWAEFLLPDM